MTMMSGLDLNRNFRRLIGGVSQRGEQENAYEIYGQNGFG
jgi:hypothetical protein